MSTTLIEVTSECDQLDMAIRNEDLPKIDERIKVALIPLLNDIKSLRPQGWRKVIFWLREAGILTAIIGAFVGLLGITVASVYRAVTDVREEANFRTNTNDRLKDIERDLGDIKAQLTKESLATHAAMPLPDFRSTLPDLRSSITAAQKQNLKITPTMMEDISNKLSATDNNTPAYWPTVSGFISYRSVVFSDWKKVDLPPCTERLPTSSQRVIASTANSLTVPLPTYTNCQLILDYPEDDSKLNKLLEDGYPQIQFARCLIIYRGGPVNLILVWKDHPIMVRLYGPKAPSNPMVTSVTGNTISFSNCIFEFSIQDVPPASGQKLAEALLKQDTANLTLSVQKPG